MSEIAVLRTNIFKLKAERDALRAENERLLKNFQLGHDINMKLKYQLSVARKALEKIAKQDCSDDGGLSCGSDYIAKEALEKIEG